MSVMFATRRREASWVVLERLAGQGWAIGLMFPDAGVVELTATRGPRRVRVSGGSVEEVATLAVSLCREAA